MPPGRTKAQAPNISAKIKLWSFRRRTTVSGGATRSAKNMGRYLALLILCCIPERLVGQALNERVLVVYNSKAPDSLTVARHYMTKRQIPDSNRCKISVDGVDYL